MFNRLFGGKDGFSDSEDESEPDCSRSTSTAPQTASSPGRLRSSTHERSRSASVIVAGDGDRASVRITRRGSGGDLRLPLTSVDEGPPPVSSGIKAMSKVASSNSLLEDKQALRYV